MKRRSVHGRDYYLADDVDKCIAQWKQDWKETESNLLKRIAELEDAIRSHVTDLSRHYQPAPDMGGKSRVPPSIRRLLGRLMEPVEE